MIKLFIGIPIPIGIKEALEKLKFPSDNLRWVKQENLHLTLYYIGDTPEEKAVHVHNILQKIQGEAFPLTFKGVGSFSQSGTVKSIWAGVDLHPKLLSLQSNISKHFEIETTQEKRMKFRPFVTLARADNVGIDVINQFLHRYKNFLLSPFSVSRFTLFSVSSHNKNVIYQQEADYSLIEDGIN